MTKFLLGVDIGSYESKGVLTDAEGVIVATSVCTHELEFVKPGFVEHDAETIWWGEFRQIVRDLLDQTGVDSHDIAAVAVSGVFSMLPVDAVGNPTRSGAIMYGIDTRSETQVAEVIEHFGADPIFEHAGMAITVQHMGPKIMWLRQNEPDAYNSAAYFLPCSSFLVQRLTGEFVIDHLQAAFYAPMYDLQNQCWNLQFCEPMVEPSKLPPIKWSNEIAGTVNEAASAATGLAIGTPVIVGSADVAPEALSVGVSQPGEMMLMYGSTAFMVMVLEHPQPHRDLWTSPYLFPGTHCMLAGMATSGSLTRWFRDRTAPDAVLAESDGGPEAYQVLTEEAAATPPGANGLIVLPYFSGERSPINDPHAKGMIFGLDITHTRGDLYRAALEGVGYSIGHTLDVMRRSGADPQTLYAIGGGVKNSVWLQAVSDITGVPQRVPSVALGASYGNAFLAGLAVDLTTPDDILKWVSIDGNVTPNPNNSVLYEQRMEIYLALYEATKQHMHALG